MHVATHAASSKQHTTDQRIAALASVLDVGAVGQTKSAISAASLSLNDGRYGKFLHCDVNAFRKVQRSKGNFPLHN